MIVKGRKFSNWYLVPFVFLFFLIGAAVYLNYTWKPILTSRIKEAIRTSTNGLYRIEFDNIRVNVITGRLRVSSIRFLPDKGIYDRMATDSIAPRHMYRVEVANLELNNVNPLKIYFDRSLEMGSIMIERPSLEVAFSNVINTNDSLKDDSRTAWQRIAPYLKSVKIGDITFRNADFHYIDNSNGGHRTSLENVTLKFSDLLIDSLSQFDQSRLYYTKDIYAEVNGYQTLTADSNYVVQINQLQASTAGNYAQIKGFRLIPRFGEMEFSYRDRFQKPRYSVSMERVRLNQVDYKALNTSRKLLASSLKFETLNLSIFLNRELRDSLRDRGANFPQLALKRFNLETQIDTVHIENSTVNYSEFNPDSKRKGTVTFSKIYGNIRNVSNDPLVLAKDRIATANLTALLMDRGRLNARFNFDLLSERATFDLQGSVGLMDASIFNKAIRPLSLIEIRSGNLTKLDFKARGDVRGINGKLTLRYNDLKINLLEKSEANSWLRKKSIASIFANVLIIKSDNPMPGQLARTASFSYLRPAHGSFFNLIWKGMSLALLESIGLDEQTQREIQRRLKRMEQERMERGQRRDDRLKKRDERRSKRPS